MPSSRTPCERVVACASVRECHQKPLRQLRPYAHPVHRFHRWLRGLLWWWVFLVGLSVILGWLFGDWHSAWSLVQTIGLTIVGLGFVYLIVAGFIELRNRDDSD
jgi:hypothetical protein